MRSCSNTKSVPPAKLRCLRHPQILSHRKSQADACFIVSFPDNLIRRIRSGLSSLVRKLGILLRTPMTQSRNLRELHGSFKSLRQTPGSKL